MKRSLAPSVLAFLLFATQMPAAFGQNAQDRLIIVSSTGTVSAKADLAILTLTIRSTAPLASDAAAQNARKTKDVQAALATLGYSSNQYKLTSITFAPAGGAYSVLTQNSVTGIQASQFLYVFFEGSSLNDDSKFTHDVAVAIDALGKTGAMLGAAPFPYSAIQQGSAVTYTIKDPDSYEKEAVQKATESSHAEAQTIAQQMGIHISEMYRVSANLVRATRQQPDFRLEELPDLPYRYFSAQRNAVDISETATVNYAFK
ncbi:MAG TPA: SIMPL domain-containing protein [Candidatus Acidoferrales bacterium]|nr:SIMPL domain-containing protein [Candidatus Acidoferrales bacterium]